MVAREVKRIADEETQKYVNSEDFKVMVDGEHVDTLEPPVQEQYRHTNVGKEEPVPITLFNFNIILYNYDCTDH